MLARSSDVAGGLVESHTDSSAPTHQSVPNLRIPPFESEIAWGPNQAECTPQHRVAAQAPLGELGGWWPQTQLLPALDQPNASCYPESIPRPPARVVHPFTHQ